MCRAQIQGSLGKAGKPTAEPQRGLGKAHSAPGRPAQPSGAERGEGPSPPTADCFFLASLFLFQVFSSWRYYTFLGPPLLLGSYVAVTLAQAPHAAAVGTKRIDLFKSGLKCPF